MSTTSQPDTGRTLIFDPFAGISGDMMLGALIDLGLSGEWLRDFVRTLDLGPIEVHVERAMRAGIDCGRVRFDLPHEHAHRHLRHVVEIIAKCDVSEQTRTRAEDAFRRIAQAEASVHGTTIEKVHFHEVGALDAILDVVCTMAGIEVLGFDRFHTRPVALGSGTIDIAHGAYPVPAPATLRVLEGVAVTGADIPGECTTPTGAAILMSLTGGAAAPGHFIPLRSGYGAGTRDPKGRPNCLRLITCASVSADDAMVLVQADVDDLAPEYAAAAQDAVLAAGANDVVLLPIAMKKGRSALRLEALTDDAHLDAVAAALFRSTPTIGLRHWRVERPALERSTTAFDWRGHRIRCKTVTLPDGTRRTKPEFEDVRAAAEAEGMEAWQVRRDVDRLIDSQPPG